VEKDLFGEAPAEPKPAVPRIAPTLTAFRAAIPGRRLWGESSAMHAAEIVAKLKKYIGRMTNTWPSITA